MYVSVAKYQALRGGTNMLLSTKHANKKAIVNIKNTDNECLKLAIRAALFPPRDGKNLQRPRTYPVNDGVDYTGVRFPAELRHMDRLGE